MVKLCHIYLYVYMYVCMYVYVHLYECISVCMDVSMCNACKVIMHANMCICVYMLRFYFYKALDNHIYLQLIMRLLRAYFPCVQLYLFLVMHCGYWVLYFKSSFSEIDLEILHLLPIYSSWNFLSFVWHMYVFLWLCHACACCFTGMKRSGVNIRYPPWFPIPYFEVGSLINNPPPKPGAYVLA